MIVTYNVNGKAVQYLVDDKESKMLFPNVFVAHDYITRTIDPFIERFHWYKLENNVLRFKNRTLLS